MAVPLQFLSTLFVGMTESQSKNSCPVTSYWFNSVNTGLFVIMSMPLLHKTLPRHLRALPIA